MITADEVRKFQKDSLENMYNREEILLNIENCIRDVMRQSFDNKFAWYSGEFRRFESKDDFPGALVDVMNVLKKQGFDVVIHFGKDDDYFPATEIRIGW